jgi:hypothetical protein
MGVEAATHTHPGVPHRDQAAGGVLSMIPNDYFTTCLFTLITKLDPSQHSLTISRWPFRLESLSHSFQTTELRFRRPL